MNPAIDLSYEVDQVHHTRKNRARNERHFPGGGGINVARVLARLGGEAHCLYLAGGLTAPVFHALMQREGLASSHIEAAGPTRIATAVFECETGKEYRFTPDGPEIHESEWAQCLEALARNPSDWLVLSGSLPRGAPPDFYAQAARQAASAGTKCVLDTSGDALRKCMDAGDIYLATPNLRELEEMAGRSFANTDEIGGAAQALVNDGKARLIAVTLGKRGAVLASDQGVFVLPALTIEARSTVGAGDSFVAGMVHGLSCGEDIGQAFRLGIAAGTAAVLTEGSDLAKAADIDKLLPLVGPARQS